MLFMHTIDKVLAGTKTATSRLWKTEWGTLEDMNGNIAIVYGKAPESGKRRRKLYYIGQVVSAQPKRGAKGVAKIRILALQKRDVRYFTSEDVRREGYTDYRQFIQVWTSMHNKSLYRKAMRQTFDFYDAVGLQDAEYYTALFIRFELVQEA